MSHEQAPADTATDLYDEHKKLATQYEDQKWMAGRDQVEHAEESFKRLDGQPHADLSEIEGRRVRHETNATGAQEAIDTQADSAGLWADENLEALVDDAKREDVVRESQK